MKAVHSPAHRPRPTPRQEPQRGVILLVALIVLLVMTLTGLAVVRTSTQGAGMAGSLALKQGATSGADFGLERGMAQLDALYSAGSATLEADADGGYFASHDPGAPLDWSQAKLVTEDDGLGNKVEFLIHRLCRDAGRWDAAGQSCVLPQELDCPGPSETAGSASSCNARPMYRITARATGPRSTLSLVQMTVY